MDREKESKIAHLELKIAVLNEKINAINQQVIRLLRQKHEFCSRIRILATEIVITQEGTLNIPLVTISDDED